MSAEVLKTSVGTAAYLTPSGPLSDPQALENLRTTLSECLKARQYHVVINLCNVPLGNSLLLETFLDFHNDSAIYGGSLTLTEPNSILSDIFRISGVADLIEVNDDRFAEADRDFTAKPGPKNIRLGDLLVELELVSAEKVEEAIALQESSGKRMGQILVAKQWLEEKQLLQALSIQLDVQYVRLRAGLYDPEVVSLLDKATAMRLKILPLFSIHGELTVATADPQAIPSFDEIEQRTGLKVRPVLALSEDIVAHISESLAGEVGIDQYVGDLDEDFELLETEVPDDYAAIDDLAGGSPVINLVNAIIQRAIRDGASDIHIEPSRAKSRVRYRIDGILYEVMASSLEVHPATVSRLKVMAKLDISERRLPQDGRIQVSTNGRIVDLRFSSLPGIFGEKVVLRVLDKNQSILDIDKLGLNDNIKENFIELLKRSHGLLLVTGPTGSGKTTSLYAALNFLNSTEKSIVTIEDPVEYQIDIINQNQTKESIGLTFAKLLKHVLRQDPDIVMIGEIRDKETAEIAVQAALTGHLVLSTLHTNDAISAIVRLVDMGIEPYLLSSALMGILAQRLIRTVCDQCKTSFVAPPELIKQYGWESDSSIRLSKGRGCNACYDSGYKGRMPVHELVESTLALQQLMMSDPSRDALIAYQQKAQIRTLYDDGISRVMEGLTTPEEISRVLVQE